jgi:peptide/nickel transport system substrate-binding protein
LRKTLLAVLAALAIAPASRAAAADLSIAVSGAVTSLDPHFHDLSPNSALGEHFFDPLVRTDDTGHPIPGLALSWKAVTPTEWEIKLRPGVTFHDGSPFTADDVAFTIARIPTVPNSPASFAIFTKPITQVEVPDKLTLRLHTAAPLPLMPMNLSGFLIVGRKHGEGATTGDYNTGKAVVGTGPYRLVSFTINDRTVMQRNDAWWGPKQDWEHATLRLIPANASRVAALQSGDVDAIDAVPTRDVAMLRRDPRLSVLALPGARLIYLFVDTRRAPSPGITDKDGKPMAENPLKDVRVRRALSLAINRDGIAQQIMDGLSAPTGQLQPKGTMGYDPTIAPDPYDPARARKLLEEAGWKDGFGITIAGPNDRYVNDAAIVQAIAQMWTRIGLKVNVDTMPAIMFFARGQREEYSANLTSWSSSTYEPDTTLIQLVASPDPARGRQTSLRPSHYANTAIDAVIDQAIETIDTGAREKLYQQATRMAMADLAVIPIHHQVNVWAVRKGLRRDPRISERVHIMDFHPE